MNTKKEKKDKKKKSNCRDVIEDRFDRKEGSVRHIRSVMGVSEASGNDGCFGAG